MMKIGDVVRYAKGSWIEYEVLSVAPVTFFGRELQLVTIRQLDGILTGRVLECVFSENLVKVESTIQKEESSE